jgi:hypothetical protein
MLLSRPHRIRALLAAAIPLAALSFAHATPLAETSLPTAPTAFAQAPLKTLPGAKHAGPLADFGTTPVSAGVREVANWAFATGDNEGRSVVILDKHAATLYTFSPQGKLFASAPVLLGLTIGDDTAPGVGDKPLAEVRDEEKTTPAGRFVAEPGEDDSGVDVVWIDFDGAVAMHRVIDKVRAERRPERLASPNARDRRISFGCINLPIPFYEKVLSPTVRRTGAIVYVLPETRSPREVFGSWDVTDPAARPPVLAHARPGTPAEGTHRPPKALREAQAVLASGEGS